MHAFMHAVWPTTRRIFVGLNLYAFARAFVHAEFSVPCRLSLQAKEKKPWPSIKTFFSPAYTFSTTTAPVVAPVHDMPLRESLHSLVRTSLHLWGPHHTCRALPVCRACMQCMSCSIHVVCIHAAHMLCAFMQHTCRVHSCSAAGLGSTREVRVLHTGMPTAKRNLVMLD